MSIANITYTYHHTCRKGHNAYIVANAPFKSCKKRIKNSSKEFIPFLGEGFYLWEENFDAAVYWGERNYKSDYNIVEYKQCVLNKEQILDFTDRVNLKFFTELRNIFIAKRPESIKWDLGTWIEFFKDLNKSKKIEFGFKYFRAKEEIDPDELKKYSLEPDRIHLSSPGYYVDLNPFNMICIVDKSNLNYSNVTVLV